MGHWVWPTADFKSVGEPQHHHHSSAIPNHQHQFWDPPSPISNLSPVSRSLIVDRQFKIRRLEIFTAYCVWPTADFRSGGEPNSVGFMLRYLAMNTSHLLSILRIVTALLFIAHGTQKLFGFPTNPPAAPMPIVSVMGVAGILETFGGLMLLLGAFTRPVAFILAGEMAVAYFMNHYTRGPWPILNFGELAILNCFIFLYLSAAGGGAWSVDAARKKH
jgi:putative oxidoreductase